MLGTLRQAATGQWFLGFAAETDDVAANGAAKLEGKRLDFLFANRVAKQGEALATGFSAETNGGILFRRDRDPVEIPTQPKAGVAKLIWNELGQTR